MDHDKHDGSYRVVRETVKCLSNIELEQIDIVDLNMLYLMTVGTWKSSFDNKRKQKSMPFHFFLAAGFLLKQAQLNKKKLLKLQSCLCFTQ